MSSNLQSVAHERAVGQKGRSDTASFQLACMALQDGRFEAAVDLLCEAIALNPENADYHYTLGRAYKAAEKLVLAEQSYRDALRFRRDYLDAWISLGILLRNLGRLQEAEDCQRQAIRIDPDSLLGRLNLGNVLCSMGRFEQATDCFRQVIARHPDCAEAHQKLGRILLDADDPQAPSHFLKALNLDPGCFEAAEGLGKALTRAGSFERAIEALVKASQLRPGATSVRLLLANAYLGARRFEEAYAEFEQLLREHPQSADAKGGIAAVLAARGQYTKPRLLFEESVAVRPDNPWVQCNYAFFLLRSGDYAKAWEHYETRWLNREHLERGFSQPRWRGESLAGRTLLITCEQGLGDEVMFASIFTEIVREAAHCIIECDQRLESLFRRSFPAATVFAVNRKERGWYRHLAKSVHLLPPFDLWTPAGTLPRYRRAASGAFPEHRGYLTADAGRTEYWSARLRELGAGPKIGISWRGGTAITNAVARSFTLDQLRPILGAGGAHFVSLQYGDCAGEIGFFSAATGIAIHQWQDSGNDYDEAAALICALDLVISVCTSVVHLGGALGRPVWVMAPFVAEWRYGHCGPCMIWYPSVRVFRQPRPDAWSPVISEVKRALRAVASP